MKTKVNISR